MELRDRRLGAACLGVSPNVRSNDLVGRGWHLTHGFLFFCCLFICYVFCTFLVQDFPLRMQRQQGVIAHRTKRFSSGDIEHIEAFIAKFKGNRGCQR